MGVVVGVLVGILMGVLVGILMGVLMGGWGGGVVLRGINRVISPLTFQVISGSIQPFTTKYT